MLSAKHAELHLITTDLLVVLLTQDSLDDTQGPLARLSERSGVDLSAITEPEHFKAKEGQTFLLRGLANLQSSRVLLVGLGEEKKITTSVLKDAGARAMREAKKVRALNVAVQPHDIEGIEAMAVGLLVGAYDYTTYLTPDEDTYGGIAQIDVLGDDDRLPTMLERAEILGAAINTTRDLVNAPPQDLYPETMADRAVEIANARGLDHKIFDEQAIEQKGFNLLMAVGKGSAHQPRMIHLTYKPEGEVRHKIAFVGKGVTFDTGGNNIKTGGFMYNMHSDMAGGGAVLGAADAIGALKPEGVEVHFIVPAAENSASSNAMRPNDIYRGYGNQTVEIGNTDAEGRLCLADALAYAQEQGVDTIIDLATLTGACVVALGDYTCGLFTDSDELLGDLDASIESTGEDFWRLPLHKKLDKQLDSSVADMKNIGKRYGGAITAALFLKRWVKIDRWAHMDIAAPAFFESSSDTHAAGGTGFGVATLVTLAERLGEQK